MPPTPMDQWRSLNVVLKMYKVIGLLLGILAVLLSAVILYLVNRPPVVVVWKDNEKHFLYPETRKADIDKKDIHRFVFEYIHLRYSGQPSKETLGNIEPLVTDPFLKREHSQLRKNGEPLQSVSNLKVSVTKKSTIATFDRILRVKGIPFVVPTKATFRIVKDSPTRWNPIGLYVDGVILKETNK